MIYTCAECKKQIPATKSDRTGGWSPAEPIRIETVSVMTINEHGDPEFEVEQRRVTCASHV